MPRKLSELKRRYAEKISYKEKGIIDAQKELDILKDSMEKDLSEATFSNIEDMVDNSPLARYLKSKYGVVEDDID